MFIEPETDTLFSTYSEEPESVPPTNAFAEIVVTADTSVIRPYTSTVMLFIGPYVDAETPESPIVIVGLPATPFALVTLRGPPTAIERPYKVPLSPTTIPVVPVRSATLLRTDAVAVSV